MLCITKKEKYLVNSDVISLKECEATISQASLLLLLNLSCIPRYLATSPAFGSFLAGARQFFQTYLSNIKQQQLHLLELSSRLRFHYACCCGTFLCKGIIHRGRSSNKRLRL